MMLQQPTINEENSIIFKEEDKNKSHISSDLRKNSTNSDEGSNKVEKRRLRGKVRSKKLRDRKKNYVDELEMKIKHLQNENIELQRQLRTEKEQNSKQISEEHPKNLGHISKTSDKIMDEFLDKDTQKYKEETNSNVKDQFEVISKLMFGEFL